MGISRLNFFFLISQIKSFSNFRILKFLKLSKSENKEISIFFSIWKIKVWLQKLAICHIVNFRNLKIRKFFEFLKLQFFLFFQIKNLWNFTNWTFGICQIDNLTNFQKRKCLGISRLNFFLNFPNTKFFEFSNFEVFEIVQIGKLRNFDIFFNLENLSLASKIGNFGIVRPFDIPHYSQFCQFSYLPFDINQFRRFNFLTFISYTSGNFLDLQIHTIIKFPKLFSFEN